MELTGELAEILGMFAADGCLQKEYICMWGNIHEDKDYYDQIVCPFYSRVFNKKVGAHEKKSNSVYGFYLCDKSIVNFFRSLGFTNNKTYDVRIPEIVINHKNPEILAAFVRGFADCDGCFSLMKRKGNYNSFKLNFNTYPRISIKTVSRGMIGDLHLLLTKLNIRHTFGVENKNKKNEGDAHWIMIRGEKNIENWMKVIGFNNPSKRIKYGVWKMLGHCPPKSGIEERKLFLKRELNPQDFY